MKRCWNTAVPTSIKLTAPPSPLNLWNTCSTMTVLWSLEIRYSVVGQTSTTSPCNHQLKPSSCTYEIRLSNQMLIIIPSIMKNFRMVLENGWKRLPHLCLAAILGFTGHYNTTRFWETTKPTPRYAHATAHTRPRCLISYLWYYDLGIATYTHSTQMENGLDDVYWKGPWQSRPEPTKMYNDFWSGLAAAVEVAFIIWIFTKKQRGPSTIPSARWWTQR